MPKIIKDVVDKVFRKTFWLRGSLLKLIVDETKKGGWKNDSALMDHIITSFFQK